MLVEPLPRQDLHARVWYELISEMGSVGDEQVESASKAATKRIDAYLAGGLIKAVNGVFSLTKAGKEMLALEPDPYSEEERRECYV